MKLNKKNKKRLIVIVIILVVLILISSANKINNGLKEEEQQLYFSTSDFSSLQELLENKGCTYISERYIDDIKTIYLKFKCNLYDGDISNEVFFEKMIKLVAEYINYEDFRFIDEEKNIDILVYCKADESAISQIIINGDSNYFANQNSIINARKSDTTVTEFKIELSIINDLIKNDWNSKNIYFGTKESNFKKYDIYFEEGIEVRNISGKVYNIVFTSNYTGKIINNLYTTSTFEEIENQLGEATFLNQDETLLGYLGKNIYIFFDLKNEEVSIYRIENEIDTTEFIELIEKYNEELDIKDFGNQITYLWPDYDEYNYNSNYIELYYTLKGVKISFSTASLKNGIFLYKNYTGKVSSNVEIGNIKNINEDVLENVYIESDNLVFIKEQNRSYFKYAAINDCDPEADNVTNNFLIKFNNIDGKMKEVQFLSLTKEYPNSELDSTIELSGYVWINDDTIIYCINNDGIYLYNCTTRNITTIRKEEIEYKINSFKNNILTYNETETVKIVEN